MLKLKNRIPFFIFLLVLSNYIYSQTNIFKDSVFVNGITYYGRNEYVIYYAGNLPIILSAPHGGSKSPTEIPDRTYGTLGNDTNLKELTQFLRDTISAITNKNPHVILSDLKRIKLDPNREPIEAAQGNQFALQAWNEYQSFILSAREQIKKDFGQGLYLDLHGHGHTIPKIELGYLLSSSELSKSDIEINQQQYINKSSIRNLVTNNKNSLTLAELLRGNNSFGNYLEQAGYPCVPSSYTISPGGNPYFTGGYCTQQYGSALGGTIDGIQIEHYYSNLRDNNNNLKAYVSKLSRVIIKFLEYHYGIITTGGIKDETPIANNFELFQNFPNPFNPSTQIRFNVHVANHITLKVFDILGREVETLVDEFKAPGKYNYQFSTASGGLNSQFPSGVYFYQLRTGDFIQTKKMIVTK
jgi:hypothetical protein